MIRIYGDSDDTVVVESDNETKEFHIDENSQSAIIKIADWIEIEMEYYDPCWGFLFIQLQQGQIPWPISVDTEYDHSVVIEIECDNEPVGS